MMGIQFIQDKFDQASLSRTLKRVSKATGKDVNKLVVMASKWALQSAAKATKPGKGYNVNKLSDKARYRPIKIIPGGFEHGYWYVWGSTKSSGLQSYSGRFYHVHYKLISGVLSRRLFRVKYGLEYWSRRSKKMKYLPYWDGTGEKNSTYAKGYPHSRIPNAGAAKYGWISALRKVGGKAQAAFDIYQADQTSTVSQRPGYMVATNKVNYQSKISPRAASAAVRNTERRIDGWYRKVLKAKYKRMMK